MRKVLELIWRNRIDVETIKQYAPNWESYKDGLK